MRFYLIVLSAIFVFGGCSGSNAFSMFNMDEKHEVAVEQLRTSSIVSSMETKAIISSVYLNEVDSKKYSDGENFIVSLYIHKDNISQKRRDLENSGYRVTLNDANATVIEKLDENDHRRELTPIKNAWNQYYYMKFDSNESDRLILKLQKDDVGETQLVYQKL